MKFYSQFSRCWYSINQLAEEGADNPCVVLHGDDPNDDKNLYGTMEVCFEEGFVSCWRPFLDSIDSLLCTLMTEQILPLWWLHIYQMAGKGAESPFVQLLSVDSKNDEILDGKMECRFEEGFVSCWSTLPQLHFVNRNDSTKFHVLFSHHLYSIDQMAGKGVDIRNILQVHGDDPVNGKNWPREVDRTNEGIFDEGYVSCWSTLPLAPFCVS